MDLSLARALITRDREEAIVSLIGIAMEHNGLKGTQPERLLGLLVSVYPIVPLDRLMMPSFQRHVIVISALRKGRSQDSWIPLPMGTLWNLQWWADPEILLERRSFFEVETEITVFADALARQVAPPRVAYRLASVEDGLCSLSPPLVPTKGGDSTIPNR